MGQRRFEATRCEGCGLHEQLCVCAQRPRLALKTAILVVQNNKERNKPTNTARLLPQVLDNCELIRFGARGVAFDPSPLTRPERDYSLIFPRVRDPEGRAPELAPPLDPARFAAGRAAAQTVVLLDGTWAQCSRMSRRVPELAAMQAFALPPGPPSHWGVRTPSEPSRISTFEAAVRVVELVEGPGPALALQTYFDQVAAGMLFMKAKLRSPAVPGHWIDERQRRFAPSS
ncbi:DTW domain protein [Enhygromyxa salina]|uniref:tRNA-uridine aminocarboxypropyltransferase n=1 Tax=Enhygromyxa salina TaxID=215803 RepID=A0A2S9YCF3_9BACT|nr:tRNA-uridine aminocarboxypropyltransferase [Enhygromyxa salina]PRQ02797.1 DTW domain protein [Enhygromyxa salina]